MASSRIVGCGNYQDCIHHQQLNPAAAITRRPQYLLLVTGHLWSRLRRGYESYPVQAEAQAEVQVSEVEVYAQNELRMARLEQYPCAVLRVL